MKSRLKLGMRKILLSLTLSTFILPSFAFPGETYEFERMWPTMQQPWFFKTPVGVVAEIDGIIFVLDRGNSIIWKFSSGGALISKWGNRGGGNGEFNYPNAMTVGSNNFIYVADTNNNRVQKFSLEGDFIDKWGNYGSGEGEFDSPGGIAADAHGNIYVADTKNYRIQKFTSDGIFIDKWGSQGSEDGEFNTDPGDSGYQVQGIAIDSSGDIFIADGGNHRVQKFSANGDFLIKWGVYGLGEGEFIHPIGMGIDSNGNIYVADSGDHLESSNRIQKFTPNGHFLTVWGNRNSGDGHLQFNYPIGISFDNNKSAYIADAGMSRIQIVSSAGELITKWGTDGTNVGRFNQPHGIAIDEAGNIYVADPFNSRVQKFSSDGQFIGLPVEFGLPVGLSIDRDGNIIMSTWHKIQKFSQDGILIMEWGSQGSGKGEFSWPRDLTLDSDGNIYVADTQNHRIQKLASNGVFITEWGQYGSGEGEFDSPRGIAADAHGSIYVADTNNRRIQKFTSDGTFISEWGGQGSGDGEFGIPVGIAADAFGNIYVADSANDRFQIFTSNGQFIDAIGETGNGQGQLNGAEHICVGNSGGIYVLDTYNNRVQVFSKDAQPIPVTTESKAIIVAGGGPFEGNNLWDATQMNANFAYRALTYQGYTKDTIYYITADIDLDMDGNGLPDDVDADATNANLQEAITTWAQDANDLFIYMIDHGGNQTFRMRAAELLQAQDLDSWLDTAQGVIPGNVILVYDACRSGSFISQLLPPAGKERILATSAAANQKAVFAWKGTLSFSWLFWGNMFNGSSFYNSFATAKMGMSMLYDQTPQIEANQNGLSNEKQDLINARVIKIGNETKTADDIPYIGTISAPTTLNGDKGMIYAEGVIDSDGISRVWAVISPPDYSPGSLDIPVTDFPVLDLLPVQGEINRYEGIYEGFTSEGVYVLSVYASDNYAVLSLPKQTSVRRVNVSSKYVSGQAMLSIAGHENLGVIDATVSLSGTGFTTTTDIYGYFTLPLSEDIQPGTYDLIISAPDMSPMTVAITLSEVQGLEAGTLQMTPAGSNCTQADIDQAVADAAGNFDPDNDGRIGLPEAINALQVVSGLK